MVYMWAAVVDFWLYPCSLVCPRLSWPPLFLQLILACFCAFYLVYCPVLCFTDIGFGCIRTFENLVISNLSSSGLIILICGIPVLWL